jgi:hypothetical protein
MYFRDCKTLSVFERKIPLTLRVQISPITRSIFEKGEDKIRKLYLNSVFVNNKHKLSGAFYRI